jgi:hypothetical protein
MLRVMPKPWTVFTLKASCVALAIKCWNLAAKMVKKAAAPAKLSKANVTLLGIGWSEDLCLDNQVTLTLSVVATTADMYYLTIRAIFL